MNGKGDTPRRVDRKKWERNFDAIRWRSKKLKTRKERCDKNM
jgi:hypothetical protein